MEMYKNDSSSTSLVAQDMSSVSRKSNAVKSKTPRPNAKSRSNKNHDLQYARDSFSQQIENQIKQNKKFSGSNRKNQISINHLLDFQSYRDSDEYHKNLKDDRRRGSNSGSRPRGTALGSFGNGNGTSSNYRVHLRGMTFINVNYKFVVDNRRHYHVQELDPNVPVDTSDIIRIIVPKGNACPICLTDEPVAPRMITSCGHIICLKCVLSLLESEVPNAKKKESSAVVEKYRECPLCSSIVRKNELKPVLVNNIDENLETPKVNDEVALTLMARPQSRIFPLPKPLMNYFDTIDHFPWINQQNPDCNQYSRIFKGDLAYLMDMYEFEKSQIRANYEEEKLLYGEDDTYFKMAVTHIDQEIANWTSKLAEEVEEKRPTESTKPVVLDVENSQSYFYYQTGFNSATAYVLSPLDMKVLKTSYNSSYTELPSSIIAKIENIKYEYLTPEASLTKYKYLSHLPLGTQIGFLECNWYHNEFISKQAWETFKEDLNKRSKNSSRKFKREEKNRRRAMNEEEIRTRNFYIRENTGRDVDDFSAADYATMGSLSIVDNRELPVLTSDHHSSNNEHSSGGDSEAEYETTIWGTKIRKADVSEQPSDEDDWDAEEMIRKAREEMERQERESGVSGKKKKKKKKLILLSSNSGW
ncbi:hypothetical protein G9P44_004347 [Scheffersomyces stipitis]|nr:hypothetical protein G9P44_004347 [Scheffersomyces stipitis]